MEGFWRQIYNLNPSDEDKDKFYSEEEKEKWGWAKQIYE
jgi:hypothetical protein